MTDSNHTRLINIMIAQAAKTSIDMTKLADALGVSSLQQAAFLDAVNSEFGVNIPPEEAANVKSLDDLVALINKN